MRSITFISALVFAGPLFAGPPEGCFARTYTVAHMAAHPAQSVSEISVAFGDFDGDDVPWVDVIADFGDDGRLGQIARCTPDTRAKAGWACSVECDGGTMLIDRLDDAGLLLRTQYFSMSTGDDCGGSADLAEVPGQFVSYRLDRQPASACAGRW